MSLMMKKAVPVKGTLSVCPTIHPLLHCLTDCQAASDGFAKCTTRVRSLYIEFRVWGTKVRLFRGCVRPQYYGPYCYQFTNRDSSSPPEHSSASASVRFVGSSAISFPHPHSTDTVRISVSGFADVDMWCGLGLG